MKMNPACSPLPLNFLGTLLAYFNLREGSFLGNYEGLGEGQIIGANKTQPLASSKMLPFRGPEICWAPEFIRNHHEREVLRFWSSMTPPCFPALGKRTRISGNR